MEATIVHWVSIQNTPDYITSDGQYVAIYDRTIKGLGSYKVYDSSVPKGRRNSKTMLGIGGLPTRIGELQIEDYNVTLYGSAARARREKAFAEANAVATTVELTNVSAGIWSEA